LETFCLTSNSSTLVFGMSNETYMDMNEAFQTISHLPIHKIRHSWPQLTTVDFLWFQLKFSLTDELWSSNLGPNHFKMIPRPYELDKPTLGPCLNGNGTCLLDWLILLISWPNLSAELALGQMDNAMLCSGLYYVNELMMKMYVQNVGANLRCYSCPYSINWEPERMRATAIRLSG
jgi:hypothetical protein